MRAKYPGLSCFETQSLTSEPKFYLIEQLRGKQVLVLQQRPFKFFNDQLVLKAKIFIWEGDRRLLG